MSVYRLPDRDGARSGDLLPGVTLESILAGVTEQIAARVAEQLRPLLTAARPAAMVDREAAAKLIDVPPSWLAAEARRGTFRSYKHRHYRRYDPQEVIEDFKRLAGGPK